MRLLANYERVMKKLMNNGAGPTEQTVHTFHRTFARLALLRDAGFQPGYVVDVGASDGRWTARCLKLFPWAQFFCVEPLDEHQAKLAESRRSYSHINYWQGCLGAEPGELVLNADGDGSSILRGHTDNPYGEQRKVRVETLDRLITEGACEQPDLIKLDVQGYELEVLKGATETLLHVEAVVAEVSFFSFQTGMPIFHEVVAFMAERGFVVADILGMIMRPLDGATAQADVLFMKHDHPLRLSNQWDRDSTY